MKTAAVTRDPAAQRTAGSPFQMVAGFLVGALVVGLATIVRARQPQATRAAPSPAVSVMIAGPLASSQSSSTGEAPLDLDAIRKKDRQAHRDALDRHEREVRDPSWATPTEQSLRVMLGHVQAHASFRVASVDCRERSCVAVIEFPSYALAQSNWSPFLNTQNSVSCGTAITLFEPEAGAKNYSFSIFYDCAEARRTATPTSP